MARCESTISLLNPNLIWDVAHFALLNLPHARKIRDFMRSRQCRRNAPWRAPCCSSKFARNDQNNQSINGIIPCYLLMSLCICPLYIANFVRVYYIYFFFLCTGNRGIHFWILRGKRRSSNCWIIRILSSFLRYWTTPRKIYLISSLSKSKLHLISFRMSSWKRRVIL